MLFRSLLAKSLRWRLIFFFVATNAKNVEGLCISVWKIRLSPGKILGTEIKGAEYAHPPRI